MEHEHNPIAAKEWPLRAQKDGCLLWIGRMAESKGPHRAIAAARRANLPLVLAYREAAAGTTAHYGSGLGLGARRANGRAAAGDLLAASAPGDRAPRGG